MQTHIFEVQHDQLSSVNQPLSSKEPSLSHQLLSSPQPSSSNKNYPPPHYLSSPASTTINKVKWKHNTFTLSQLKKRQDWPEWEDGIFKQLDQYHDQHTFGDPQPLPRGENLLDGNNTKKARCVCNGSPCFHGTVTLAEKYASVLDQTGAKMFWARVAINNYVVLGADASNAFAEATPPKDPLFV